MLGGGKQMQSDLWTENSMSLFISHVNTNKEVAADIKQHLEPYWISAFVAPTDIEPTKQWVGEIVHSLRNMDAMLTILSREFHSSNWTDQEVGFAVCRGILIVPLKIDIDPYGFNLLTSQI